MPKSLSQEAEYCMLKDMSTLNPLRPGYSVQSCKFHPALCWSIPQTSPASPYPKSVPCVLLPRSNAHFPKVARTDLRRTHGTNRPFLPAQIRKNEPVTVKSATSAGFATAKDLTTVPPTEIPFPTETLNHLTTLTGVGPATATLLLSIGDPTHMPFFQDELFHWLCGGDGDAGAGWRKLKYSMKEYKELFGAVAVFRQRLADTGVTAEAVEKVGFVVGHLDVLEAGEVDELRVVLAKDEGVRADGRERGTKRMHEKVSVAEKNKTNKSEAQRKGKGDGKPVTSATRKRKAAAPEIPASSSRKAQRSQ